MTNWFFVCGRQARARGRFDEHRDRAGARVDRIRGGRVADPACLAGRHAAVG